MELGWIKLHRKLLEWEWYDDANTFRLFIHCLLECNYTEKEWRGIIIEKGSFITSPETIAKKLKLSRQQIRTSINKLILSKNITIKTTNKYTVVTVVKYSDYQFLENENNQQNNKQITNNQPTNNQQITTTKNIKNINKENNKIKFDVFWNLYNKKVGSKLKCEKKWNNLNLETQQKIIDTLPTFLKSITDKQYQPHAETYLNQERWNDEIQTKPEHAMNKLREFYKECEQPHERQRIHKIAMIFEQTKVLKYKPIDFTHDFMYEHLRSCMQHFTRWEGELENFILKNDNENKSIKQLFIEFRNKYRD